MTIQLEQKNEKAGISTCLTLVVSTVNANASQPRLVQDWAISALHPLSKGPRKYHAGNCWGR